MRDYHQNYKKIKKISKAELHLHLDGSITPAFMIHMSKCLEGEAEKGGGFLLPPELRENERLLRSKIVATHCDNLLDYLDKFFYPLWATQTRYMMTQSVINIAEQLHNDNVTYFELRFAPTLHMRCGLGIAEMIHAAIDGLQTTKELFGIEGRLILIAMRQEGPSVANYIVREVQQHWCNAFKDYIVGFDAAGYEMIDPKLFRSAFQMAKRIGLMTTFHIGENCPAYMIGDVIDRIQPDRMAHCYRAVDDKGIMRALKDSDMVVELCPSSSFHTGSVKHKHLFPIRYMLDFGIPVVVCSDNLTVSNTNLTNELCFISDFVDEFEMRNIIGNGFRYAFDYSGAIEPIRTEDGGIVTEIEMEDR